MSQALRKRVGGTFLAREQMEGNSPQHAAAGEGGVKWFYQKIVLILKHAQIIKTPRLINKPRRLIFYSVCQCYDSVFSFALRRRQNLLCCRCIQPSRPHRRKRGIRSGRILFRCPPNHRYNPVESTDMRCHSMTR